MYEQRNAIISSGDQYFPSIDKEELPVFTQIDQSGLFQNFSDYPPLFDSVHSGIPSTFLAPHPALTYSPFTPPSCSSSNNNSPLTSDSSPSPVDPTASPSAIITTPTVPHSQSYVSPSASLLSASHSTPLSVSPSPSPPQLSVDLNSSQSGKRKGKRRRKDEEVESKESLIWTYYTAPSPVPPPVYHIYDAASQLITKSYDIAVKMEINATYSPSDGAWICYRQNQFKVNCALKHLPTRGPTYVSKNGALVAIARFCMKLYAIKDDPNVINEVQVGIHHMGKSRTKKEKSIISITPFVDDRLEFSNIQFEKSNAIKGQKIDYFRIVLAFYAQSIDMTCYHIFSKVSPRLIVRSQNPGFYKENPPSESDSVPPTPLPTYDPPTYDPPSYDPPAYDPPTNSSPSHSSPSQVPQPTFVDTKPMLIDSKPALVPDMVASQFMQKTKSMYGIPAQHTPSPPHAAPSTPPSAFASAPFNFLGTEGYGTPNQAAYEWQNMGGNMIYTGKVGINTSTPSESLTVNGNIMLTGNLFKPSDMRIKSNIESVDPYEQMKNIRNLKIYDYLIQSRKERGVLAQELAQQMPHAVHVAGDVHIDDKTIPNFLVVNERVLLFENIGATQQLDKEVESDKRAIVDISSRVNDLEVTSKDSDHVRSLLHRVVDVVTDTEKAPKMPIERNPNDAVQSWSENVTHGLTWFSIGPSRSMWIVGFFIPFVWIIGSLYIFSKIPTRRAGGILNLVMWLIYLSLSLVFGLSFLPGKLDEDEEAGKTKNTINTIFMGMGVAVGVVFVVVRRIRKRVEKKRKQERLRMLRLDLINTLQQQQQHTKNA